MKTAFAIVGAAYIAACILAKLGYADMQVCFAWKGSCAADSIPSEPIRRGAV
ncbi:hypothetical protein [Pseudacidovorax intermedius]|uniref:hypothetical protein n=1 Tax=Pseudacidovorax intermedius TaxID=433924 RepID=UPI00187CD3A3|nr:hypothetical protein [Pseudacidovorax intermedius]